MPTLKGKNFPNGLVFMLGIGFFSNLFNMFLAIHKL